MPYQSKAQQRFFHASGKISPEVVKEFDSATRGKFKDLPEKVAAFAYGYVIGTKEAAQTMGVKAPPPATSGAGMGVPKPPTAPAIPQAPKMPEPPMAATTILQTNAANVANAPQVRLGAGSTFPIAR